MGLCAVPGVFATLAARGESPAAFGRRCIPADCVAPPSNIPDILGRRALSSGRLAALGATPDFHHGLLEQVLEAELHLTRNGISRTRDASERGRTEVPVRRLEIWRVRDVEHLEADLDTPGSGLA